MKICISNNINEQICHRNKSFLKGSDGHNCDHLCKNYLKWFSDISNINWLKFSFAASEHWYSHVRILKPSACKVVVTLSEQDRGLAEFFLNNRFSGKNNKIEREFIHECYTTYD